MPIRLLPGPVRSLFAALNRAELKASFFPLVAINKFDFTAAMRMAEAIKEMTAALASR